MFEKEVCEYLSLPSVPVKQWDGQQSFKDGVAVVEFNDGEQAYAIATYNADIDTAPRIKKIFSLQAFSRIVEIFVVPSYMDVNDIEQADLDKESKEAAKRLADEAKQLEQDGAESEQVKEMKSLPEWVFDNIHNAEEAQAYIQQYNSRNRIKGRIPKNEDTLKMRLLNIYNEMQNNKKQ